ncbi:MAG: hypothetical protein R3A10_14655 [Caldilineaceae bacterium]
MGPAINALTDIISDPYPGHSVIPSICAPPTTAASFGETIDDVLRPLPARRDRRHPAQRDHRHGRVCSLLPAISS